MNNKIFIQIASYRDPELFITLKNCIESAEHPENLVFSIAWQHSEEDQWDHLDPYLDDPRFKIIDIPHHESTGACWARNTLQQQYDGEEYTLQLDSHHRFAKHWDTQLIKMYKDLQAKGHEKPLLTTYASVYKPADDPGGRIPDPYQMNFDRFIPEGAIFFLPAVIPDWKKLDSPVPARFYSAHYAFTTGKFAVEVQHDPNYYFHGEEISIAVRAYTHGYDLFHPHIPLVWHEYTREGRIKQWDDDKFWGDRNSDSHLRNRKLFEMDGHVNDLDFGIYGFGTERTLSDYEKYSGISFKKRSILKYTLDNKYPPGPLLNDEEFEKALTRVFKHFVTVHKGAFDKDKDYDFWAVIFENEDGESLYRKDLSGNELKVFTDQLKAGEEFINIPVEFKVEKHPYKWIVWPNAEDTWLDKIENKL